MDLFNSIPNKNKNRLPYDGTVNYYGKILSKEQADFYFNKLLENIEWRHDEALIFGKKITTKRKVAWYAEKRFEYTYSNTTKMALPWTRELLKKDGAIASISLGAERKFAFKHKKTREKVELILQHGSLLVMKGATQTNWLHRLPPTKKIKTPRINLTFRTIQE